MTFSRASSRCEFYNTTQFPLPFTQWKTIISALATSYG
ncbi:unnamed protein product, partial [Didymodactylos carnosus]